MDSKNRQIICEITDKTFDPNYKMGDIREYGVRTAARGIVYKGKQMAVMNVTKIKYYKLPGGGAEKGESNEETFKREIREEVGCECEILEGGPIIIEFRDRYKLLQLSYIFLAKIIGNPGVTALEPDEVKEGLQVEWMTVEQAEKVWEVDEISEYEGHFIHLRDKEILKYYKSKLTKLMRNEVEP